ncbi:helix-turn-helix domain-containing protein [Candidatus Binatus sp.]|jgi:excisionase family DNA binding protein|uniref:helix-turn-helix domain-containing protein n=1 Tax=Candidatus Binatus sp. TaxID=2811406 RepID=UPI003C674C48
MKPHSNATSSRLMTTREVAHYLRVNQGTLYKLIRRGHIPAFKIGSDYRFDRNAIERLMTNRQVTG